MTREEAITYGERKEARIQEKLRRAGSSHGDYAIYYSEMAFTSVAIAALRDQEERRWIPVTERLPDQGDRVLCVVKSFAFPGSKYYNILRCDMYGFNENGIYTDDVTHWMPMPEPPKEME